MKEERRKAEQGRGRGRKNKRKTHLSVHFSIVVEEHCNFDRGRVSKGTFARDSHALAELSLSLFTASARERSLSIDQHPRIPPCPTLLKQTEKNKKWAAARRRPREEARHRQRGRAPALVEGSRLAGASPKLPTWASRTCSTP